MERMRLYLVWFILSFITLSKALDITDDILEAVGPAEEDYSDYDSDQDVLARSERSVNVRPAPETTKCSRLHDLTPSMRERYNLNDTKFQHYLRAYGMPILHYGQPNFRAMQRACYEIKFMLSDNAKIRSVLYSRKVRFVLLGDGETREDIPGIILPRDYNADGAYLGRMRFPVIVFTKEYVVCRSTPTIKQFMTVLSQVILKYAIPEVYPSYKRKLIDTFMEDRTAKNTAGKYSDYGYADYFAEGTMAFFGRRLVGKVGPKELDTSGNTRINLYIEHYKLHQLIELIHPCKNTNFAMRCVSNHMALSMDVRRNCDFNITGVGSLQQPKCRDFLTNCAFYKRIEYCNHPDYRFSMRQQCPRTCGYCTDPTTPPTPENPSAAPQPDEPEWKLEILNTPPGWSNTWLGGEPEPETTATTTTQEATTTEFYENDDRGFVDAMNRQAGGFVPSFSPPQEQPEPPCVDASSDCSSRELPCEHWWMVVNCNRHCGFCSSA